MRWRRQQRPTDANPPAAWYLDPHNPDRVRYWDGAVWTDDYGPAASQSTAPAVPMVAPAAAPAVSVSTSVGVRREVGRAPQQRREQPTLEGLVATARLEPPRHPLDEQVEVVGETFHIKGIKKVFQQLGMPITESGCTLEEVECILAPEPWNPHDPNAVAVMIESNLVGYVPAELAMEYAPGLGRLAATGVLATGAARLWAKSDAGMVRGRVTILIPEASGF